MRWDPETQTPADGRLFEHQEHRKHDSIDGAKRAPKHRANPKHSEKVPATPAQEPGNGQEAGPSQDPCAGPDDRGGEDGPGFVEYHTHRGLRLRRPYGKSCCVASGGEAHAPDGSLGMVACSRKTCANPSAPKPNRISPVSHAGVARDPPCL
jgi:hypothetical protein